MIGTEMIPVWILWILSLGWLVFYIWMLVDLWTRKRPKRSIFTKWTWTFFMPMTGGLATIIYYFIRNMKD